MTARSLLAVFIVTALDSAAPARLVAEDSCCHCSDAARIQGRAQDAVCLSAREMRGYVRHFEPLKPPGLGKGLNISGEVVFEIRFGPDGKVKCVKPTSGHPMAISAAMEGFPKWRFRPVVQNGIAKDGCGPITVAYRIRDKDSSSSLR